MRGLLCGPLREANVDLGGDDPVDPVSWSLRWRDPSQRFELLEDFFGFAPRQPTHRAVAALNITMSHPLELVSENVPGHGSEPVVIIG